MASRRDNPESAQAEYDLWKDSQLPGLSSQLSLNPQENIVAPYINPGASPRVAVIREQGGNGHLEMTWAFARAGFAVVDVPLADWLAGRTSGTLMMCLEAVGYNRIWV